MIAEMDRLAVFWIFFVDIRHVFNYLSGVVQTLPDYKVNDYPSTNQIAEEFPTHASNVFNAVTDFQDTVAVMKNHEIGIQIRYIFKWGL